MKKKSLKAGIFISCKIPFFFSHSVKQLRVIISRFAYTELHMYHCFTRFISVKAPAYNHWKCSLGVLALTLVLFSSTQAQYQLNGSARQDSIDCFVLTDDTIQFASAWYLDKVDISESFDLYFRIFLGCNDSAGADGIAFVLQQVSTNVGTFGEGIGYANIAPSLAVEIDTWQNTNRNDPEFDHISIHEDGILDHGVPTNLAGPVPVLPGGNIEDCQEHDLRVVWDPDSLLLKVYVDCQRRLTYQGDIVNDIFNGDGNVFWGFTGATGGLANDQYFCLDYVSFLQQQQTVTVCQGDSVRLDVGEGLTYSWSPTTFLSDPTVRNPTARPTQDITYTVEVTNPCGGDLRIVEVNVDMIEEPPATVSNDTITCGGIPVQLQAGGGDLYRWAPATGLSATDIANPLANPLVPTAYEVVVIDTLTGCRARRIVFVDAMYVEAGEDLTICEGDTAALLAKGGDTYLWEPDPSLAFPAQANPVATPVLTSTFVVAGTNTENTCTDRDTVTVTVNLKPNTRIDVSDSILCSADTVFLSVVGGDQFAWIGDTALSNPRIANPYFTTEYNPLGNNTFSFVALGTDLVNGCVDRDTATITVAPLPEIFAGRDTTVCERQPTTLIASGGVDYSWSPADLVFDPNVPAITLNPTETVVMTATGRDANGCENIDRVRIEVLEAPETRGEDSYYLCGGQTATLRVSGGVSYLWNTGDTSSAITVAPIQTATYQVSAVNSLGCVGDTLDIQVEVNNALPQAEFSPIIQEGYAPVQVGFINISRNADNFLWDFGDGETSADRDPFHLFLNPGNYTVTLIAQDEQNACPDTTSFSFVKIRDYQMHVPTAFSPNLDGINDLFFIEQISVRVFLIQIYDRWGNKVFESRNSDFTWDGTFNGKDLPAGTYTYALRFITDTNKRINSQGTISLIR